MKKQKQLSRSWSHISDSLENNLNTTTSNIDSLESNNITIIHVSPIGKKTKCRGWKKLDPVFFSLRKIPLNVLPINKCMKIYTNKGTCYYEDSKKYYLNNVYGCDCTKNNETLSLNSDLYSSDEEIK